MKKQRNEQPQDNTKNKQFKNQRLRTIDSKHFRGAYGCGGGGCGCGGEGRAGREVKSILLEPILHPKLKCYNNNN